jgi:general secretion pathway protein E
MRGFIGFFQHLSIMTVAAKEFTDVLKNWGRLDDRDLARARSIADSTGMALHLALSKLGFVAEDVIVEAIADGHGIGVADERDYPREAILKGLLSAEFLQANRVLPIAEDNTTVTVAMADPFDSETIRAIELKLGKTVVRRVAIPYFLERQIARLLGGPVAPAADVGPDGGTHQFDAERLRDLASEVPVVRIVNRMIEDAVGENASDIHIEPADGDFQVRYRIDGMLRRVPAPPAAQAAAIVSRIKIMAHLDIVERRRPQDGRCRVAVQGRSIDLRVSSVPTIHGEGLVLRILDKATAPLDLGRLGMDPEIQKGVARVIDSKSGIFLVTGPTGSGKSTTLYAALQRLNTVDRKLITVEDPVEYELSGISQIQVNPRVGMGFPEILRSVLRHDPDVIMVGEIRDLETARIAVQSALTGHVVLSTLHTNDAPGALTRMADMGIEPFLITSALSGVMAQRLVRTLCPACKRPMASADNAAQIARSIGFEWDAHAAAFEAVGCGACGESGYQGRTAIFELLDLDDELRAAVLDRVDLSRIREIAARRGLRTLRGDGLAKVAAGVTTFEEILRITQEA